MIFTATEGHAAPLCCTTPSRPSYQIYCFDWVCLSTNVHHQSAADVAAPMAVAAAATAVAPGFAAAAVQVDVLAPVAAVHVVLAPLAATAAVQEGPLAPVAAVHVVLAALAATAAVHAANAVAPLADVADAAGA